MSTLPRQLRAWAPHLQVLQRDLAIGLGPWVQRLAAAIGALAGTADPHTGDPDGYDGVIRRGPYERLLPTEWLFAEAAPDEFNRRAATGEHQFYRLATREPNATRRCLVLFDAGPSQLGAPRIAHLAALIVFAARCEAAKAELFWGTLQAGPARVQEGFSKARAEVLLQGRSALEATPEQLQAWLSAPELKSDDVWLVGDARSPAAPKLNRLEVTDVLEVGVRRVDVAVVRPARTRLRLQLDLPPAGDCTRLLRAPFAEQGLPRPAPVPAPLPHRDLVFGIVANRLHMLGPDGELMVLPVPAGDAPQRVRAIIHRPQAGDRVVAAGWKTGAQAIVARSDADGRLTHFGVCALTRRGELKRAPLLYRVEGARPASLEGLRCAAFAFDRVLVPFPDGMLTLMGDQATFAPMPIIASAATAAGISVLTHDSKGRRLVATMSAAEESKGTLIEGDGALAAFFGRGYRGFSSASVPTLALASRPDALEWTVECSSERTTLTVPQRSVVVGASGRAKRLTGLLVRYDGGHSVGLVTEKGLTRLGHSDAPLRTVAADLASDAVAWLDVVGRIGVTYLGAPKNFLEGTLVKGSARFAFVQRKVDP